MEPDSEGEMQNKKALKPKRQMKTPFQLETLEKAYAVEAYPSEATRADLSEKLGLTDRQLQMWFCHRRLKDKKEDKKETPGKSSRKGKPLSVAESPVEEPRQMEYEAGSDYGSGSGSDSSPVMEQKKSPFDDVSMKRRYYESSPQSIMELRAIACVEAQLGQPLRQDGPILGMEFDPLPPGAFGAPIEPATEQRLRMGYPYDVKAYMQSDVKSSKASAKSAYKYHLFPDQPHKKSDSYGQVSQSPYRNLPIEHKHRRDSSFLPGDMFHSVQGRLPRVDKKANAFSSPQRDEDSMEIHETFMSNKVNVPSITQQMMVPVSPDVSLDAPNFRNGTNIQVERKYKSDDIKHVKEADAHENRIRRELEKEDILRRKSEERMRKEMERLERERRKEEERLIRERQREEERSLREQKRELERRERFLQKEHLKAEKMRQKEELRREREELKRKAAMEKANARKIAKESMDLIEDEQLELMELAAANKGLPSIVQLDYDTLQNLEVFRDSLIAFPPKSVQLKRPFAFEPWVGSEENIGNLLMVWRFCISFADVLGLWPFTLNEFVQAFHDYDSRLLSEIHISLLKLIIKDIEDVARTPTGLGTNQYTVANTEGGHPQLVDGAYLWGFDIRYWQRHLNPLTWPEIFRQLALAAGFGPRLKKSAAVTSLGNNDEVKGSEDLISILRNGVAAENAFALMRDKGLLLTRKSRNRMTPGTVKFAAYHVLSLEGGNGLTLTELAERIKKYGLRDLSTSKTPEASISVALNRDQKLFERVAPSTYCVRAPYRNDPADAEAILSVARNKIKQFENGFLGAEYVDDMERDEESDGDVDEDPEVDDLTTPVPSKSSADVTEEINCSISEKDNGCSGTPLIAQIEKEQLASVSGPEDAKTPSTVRSVGHGHIESSNAEKEKFEIDKSKPGALWVQGLTEGEYSLLSVDERLKALVALVGLANEGNTIRLTLEDRLEASNALKKQMWIEAQLDRSRLKEDIMSKLDIPSCNGVKADAQVTGSLRDGSQSPLPFLETKTEEAIKDEGDVAGSATEVKKSLSDVVDCRIKEEPQHGDYSIQQQGYTSKRSRSQLKAYIGHMAEEMYVHRSLPLGHDRRRNRYWQFVASASRTDPCAGKIFVELRDGKWRVIDSEEAFNGLVSSLDARGVRESHLRIMLQKIEAPFKENVRRGDRSIALRDGSSVEEAANNESSPNSSASVDSPSSVVCASNFETSEIFTHFRIELGRKEKEKKSALKRYQDFHKWMQRACFNSFSLCALKCDKTRCAPVLATYDSCADSYQFVDTHPNSCYNSPHSANNNLDGWHTSTDDYSVPLGIKLLKTLLAQVEASIPAEALEPFWSDTLRTMWGVKLNQSSVIEEFLQVVAVLENAIKQDFLSSNFETTQELLGFSFPSGASHDDLSVLESVPTLPWLPKTTAGVALRLFELDASIMYVKQEKVEPCEDKTVKVHMKLPSRFSPQNNKEVELKKIKQDYLKENNLSDKHGRSSSHKRGRSNNDQQNSRKLQKRVPGFKSVRLVEESNQGARQQGKRTNLQASGRGPRTVRKRRSEKVAGKEKLLGHLKKTVDPDSYVAPARNLAEEDWGLEDVRMDVDSPESSSSEEAAESEDIEEERHDEGTSEQGLYGASREWNDNSEEMIDDTGDAIGYENEVEEMRDVDSEGEVEISYDSNDGVNRIRNDDDTDSSSSDDYSE